MEAGNRAQCPVFTCPALDGLKLSRIRSNPQKSGELVKNDKIAKGGDKISLVLVVCDFALWALRMLWGHPSRLFSVATGDGFVYSNLSRDPPADPRKQGRGGTPGAVRLEIKAHVLAILGGFWDQMLLDLPLRKPRAPVHSARQEVLGELGDEMGGGPWNGVRRNPAKASRNTAQLCFASSFHPAAPSGLRAGN